MINKITYIHTSPLNSKKANIIQVLSMCNAFIENAIDVTLMLPKSEFLSDTKLDNKINLKFYRVNNRLPSFLKYNIAISKYLKNNSLEGLIFIRHYTLVFPLSKFKYKFIYESHNNNLFSNKVIDVLFKFHLKKLIKNDNFLLLFSISGELNKYWDKFFKNSTKKIDFYHDGISAQMFETFLEKDAALLSLGINKTMRKRIVYSGSIYNDRGIDSIVRLAKDFPMADFIVIGGPSSNIPKLESMASKLNIENIVFLGVIRHREIPLYLFSADVLLAFWSNKVKTINYCSPLKVFEYMASGRLILAHAYPTIKEVLNDTNSILVNPNSYEKIKEGLHKALKINNSSVIAEKSRRDVFSNYTWTIRAKYVINRINQIDE